MRLQHIVFFMIGFLSLILILIPYTPTRLGGLMMNLLNGGYCFLKLLDIPDKMVLSIIVGVFIFAFITLIINYTPFRDYNIIYGISGILFPVLVFLNDSLKTRS